MRREQAEPPPHVDLTEIAGRASYIGSPEHKDRPFFGVHPMPRSDATICPPHLDSPTQLTAWLQSAIRRGHVGAPWEGDFPRYAWYQDGDDAWYEGATQLTGDVVLVDVQRVDLAS